MCAVNLLGKEITQISDYKKGRSVVREAPGQLGGITEPETCEVVVSSEKVCLCSILTRCVTPFVLVSEREHTGTELTRMGAHTPPVWLSHLLVCGGS